MIIFIILEWLRQNGIIPDFEYVAIDKILDYTHQMEQSQMTAAKSEAYSVDTMNFIRSSIVHYLNAHPFNRNISPAFFTKMTANKENKFGDIQNEEQAKGCKSISQNDIAKIYSSGVFGNSDICTPRSLLYKVWFEIMLHFGNFLNLT